MSARTTYRTGLRGFVSLALIVLFTLASQYASANWRLGAIVASTTDVANGPTCSAHTIIKAIPIVLTRNINDAFSVWDNASWWDNRTSPASTTTYHNFTLRMDYIGVTYPDWYNATTHSGDSGVHRLNVTATVTQYRQYAYLNWTASVFVTGSPSCSRFSQNSASFLVDRP